MAGRLPCIGLTHWLASIRLIAGCHPFKRSEFGRFEKTTCLAAVVQTQNDFIISKSNELALGVTGQIGRYDGHDVLELAVADLIANDFKESQLLPIVKRFHHPVVVDEMKERNVLIDAQECEVE
ncbi:hypothetical protein FQZ97_789870 [compost metagenome]